ncbi:MAG: MerR family transcriptional regulator [Bacteroidetes bacterium]|nr:MerR family transcriptional regulator [Bacteroidota bacterium]
MKKYTVKEVAGFAGITIRTLHHYDEIGLLVPSERSETNYRYYSENDLLLLQQILFYKDLGIALNEIKDIIQNPGFDVVGALIQHRETILKRQDHLKALLITIDKTLNNLNNKIMKPEELYEGLPKEFANEYRTEAMEIYGEQSVLQSEKELLKMGKADFEQLKSEQKQINEKLFSLMGEDPASESVQTEIQKHYVVIRKFWGASNQVDPQWEAYAGLGDLYVSDERFTSINGNAQPDFAAFLNAAMKQFVMRKKGG